MTKKILKDLKKDLMELKTFAIIIYGSYVTGKPHLKSDIDICIVLNNNNKKKIEKMFKQVLRISARNEKYDIRIFEQMPLYMKKQVIENGKIIYAKNMAKLTEYFYFYRKLWQDQSVARLENSKMIA